MKKIILLLLLGFTFIFANVGKITAVKGEVSVLRDGGKTPAKSGFILKLQDKIVTQDKAKALVLFNDNTSITVGKSSTLSVNEFVMDLKKPSNSKTNFGFGKGVFRTITGKIGKINPSGFKIKTKSASIGIRGTTLDTSVKQLPDGKEQVEVAFLEGRGMITNNDTGVTTPVNTGQRASMSPTGETQVEQGALDESGGLDEDSKELEQEQQAGGDDQGGDGDNQDDGNAEEENGDGDNQDGGGDGNAEEDNNGQDDGKDKGNDDGGDPTGDPEAEPTDDPDGDPDPESDPEPEPEPAPTLEPDEGPSFYVPPIDTPTNSAPTLSVDNVTVDEDNTVDISVTAVDSDNDTLTYSITSSPSNGTATIDSTTGAIIYTPNANYSGSDTITVTVSDGTDSVSQTITITISAINDLPTISISESLSIDEDTSGTLTFSTYDADGDSVSISASAQNGTVTVSNGTIIYTPNSSYSGSDTITITISDGSGSTITETISVTVNDVSTNVIALSPIGEELDLTNVTKSTVCDDDGSCDHYSTYMDYGYILDANDNPVGAYVNGTLTPTAVIDSYLGTSQVGTYEGRIAAFNNGSQVSGTINLSMDFGSSSFTGDMNIGEGAWKATIDNGTVSTYGFSSSSISNNGGEYTVNSGSLSGKFYGDTGDRVGGSFSLDTSNGAVNGVFGAGIKTGTTDDQVQP